VVRALERAGFKIVRVSGSHYHMRHKIDANRQTTVPFHASRELPKGTLRDIIDRAGLTVDEFLGFL
jgi:predicted RNA binding protein YcfA (HicA-like mRNA interferase family)